MTYTVESYINFCDDMQIAEEGVIDAIKNKIKKLFLSIINGLQKFLSKCKDSKLKHSLMKLLDRAKRGLTKSNTIKTEEDARELKEEADDIQEEIKNVKETVNDDKTEYINIRNSDTGKIERITKEEYDKRFKNKNDDPDDVYVIDAKTGERRKMSRKDTEKVTVKPRKIPILVPDDVIKLVDRKDINGIRNMLANFFDKEGFESSASGNAILKFVKSELPEAFEPHKEMTKKASRHEINDQYYKQLKSDFQANPSAERFAEMVDVANTILCHRASNKYRK